ncbi:DUF3560 domain-containing protein [Pseudonocardia sp. T1-2H]|uniref:DUF3560 domain-containing protein n=1 Tax=Pseudonocardia sp. T1-2H TaxID=3128899 RepID=UPI0031011448
MSETTDYRHLGHEGYARLGYTDTPPSDPPEVRYAIMDLPLQQRAAAAPAIRQGFLEGWREAVEAAKPKPDPDEAPKPAVLLTLTYSAAEGTLLDGTSKGDGSAEVLHASPQLWRWSRNLGTWFVRYSRDRPPRLGAIDADRKALEAAGFEVTVEIDGKPRMYEEAEADRAQHMDERADHLAAKAERKGAESDARFAAADRTSDMIPMGQPVLVGHYSQRRHERHLEQIHRDTRKGLDALAESRQAAQRAESAASHMRHREDPYAMARRLKTRQADRDKVQRDLDGHVRNFRNGAGVVVSQDVTKPASGSWREQLLVRAEFLDEEIRGLRDALAVAKEEGRWLDLQKGDVKPGQEVRIDGRWYAVVKVNRTTVAVTTLVGALKYPLDQIRGVRDGLPAAVETDA